jgi:hypothetical protein
MQEGKKKLDMDLTFLDANKPREAAKPREAEAIRESSYKTNWRNIIITGALILGALIWISSNNSSSPPRIVQSEPASPPIAAANPPVTNPTANVQNGKFRCSSYHSAQADRLSPPNEYEITNEANLLQTRQDALNELEAQIKSTKLTQSSSQKLIDRYNAMIDRYNANLNSLKADSSTHGVKVDRFNDQVKAHNDYLLANCQPGG